MKKEPPTPKKCPKCGEKLMPALTSPGKGWCDNCCAEITWSK